MHAGAFRVDFDALESRGRQNLSYAQRREGLLVSEIGIQNLSPERAISIGRLDDEQAARPERGVGRVQKREAFFFGKMLEQIECSEAVKLLPAALQKLPGVVLHDVGAPYFPRRIHLLSADVHDGN